MDKSAKLQKKTQEFNRKQKERNMKMNIHIESTKKEKQQTLEKIIEEVHQAEDTTVDFVANDMIKQSSELQRRLAERRRQNRTINSCKNSNAKSFFRFESSIVNSRLEKLGESRAGLNNVSMIKKDSTYGEECDESFSFDILNKLTETDTSTHNMGSKLMGIPEKPHLRIETSLTNEDEEEEEESEDEKLEQNVIEIWKECEKVFETIQSEKEEATNKFLEDFTSEKFEKIAMLKVELNNSKSKAETEEEKQLLEEEFKAKIKELEKELDQTKAKGLTDIKSRFARRKQSIVSKLDLESAKNKLKASLYSKNMSFLSTPSSQSFYLSPYEPTPKKGLPASALQKQYSEQPQTKLVSPNNPSLKMPKTPNQLTKGSFNFNLNYSAAK